MQTTAFEDSAAPGAVVTPRQSWARRYGLPLVLYLLATWLTNAHFMADTGGYVVSILAYEGVEEFVEQNPVVGDYRSENPFWEFGHLLWRPLGLVLYKAFEPLSRLVVGPEPGTNLVFLLLSVNWLAGLLCVLLLHDLARRLTGRLWVAHLVAGVFIFSHGFLNFAQTGSSYIAGLSLLLLGLYLLVRARDYTRRPWLAPMLSGVALAGAVCMWFLYVWAVPAVLVSPLLLFGVDRRQWRMTLRAAAAFALALALLYAAVMAHLGISSPDDLRAWVTASSHGVSISGVTRVIFGLPRSLINMGNDGVLFKRFLIDDPFNPVTAADLFRFSLWKLALFYLSAAAIFISLVWSRQGRGRLGLLLINAIPILVFATLFDGGAVERYLPLYPLMALSLAWAISARQTPAWIKAVPLIFVAAAAVTNLNAMAASLLDRQQEEAASRVGNLLPLKPESQIAVTHLQDELVNFQASFPFHPVNRRGDYRLHSIVTLGTSQVERWREDFVARAFESWKQQADVWVSRRILSERPRPEWNWVEGDDARVSWAEMHTFFSQLETGDGVGGEDGFVLVLPSPVNAKFLSHFVRQGEHFAGVSDAAGDQQAGGSR
jgi:hypothetical protein